MNYDSRVQLIYLAIKYEGDYEKILFAIDSGEDVPYEEALEVCSSLKCQTLTLLDYDYPQKLKQVYRPPLVLFYYGDISLLEKSKSIGIVGSREASEYGTFCTEKIVSGLKRDIVVVSGLARGIDTSAHVSALNSGLRTIAVLGSGIDYCYPQDNEELYERIKKKHLIISEYPGKASPDRCHFPARNRIIVGLSNALFVPQVNSFQSGTMISINLALSMGRTTFFAPHPIDDGTINNKMLYEGAELAETADDIIEEMKW